MVEAQESTATNVAPEPAEADEEDAWDDEAEAYAVVDTGERLPGSCD
jgi:hypothetical protein